MLAPQITPCTLTIRTLTVTRPLPLYYQALFPDPQTRSFQCPKWAWPETEQVVFSPLTIFSDQSEPKTIYNKLSFVL